MNVITFHLFVLSLLYHSFFLAFLVALPLLLFLALVLMSPSSVRHRLGIPSVSTLSFGHYLMFLIDMKYKTHREKYHTFYSYLQMQMFSLYPVLGRHFGFSAFKE